MALAALRKYVNICRASLIERLTYRGDFFFSTVLRFLPMLTTILLWGAIYNGAREGTTEDRETVVLAGYRFREMIAYLLLVHVSRMFSSMPGLATGIARDIRDGSIKKYLVQPLDMVGYLVAYRVAHKIAYIITSAIPYAGLFLVCLDYFDGWPDAVTMLAYVASLLMGFVVGFFFEAALGMLGFWILEVTSLLYVINTLVFFMSGHMFPLDLLPPFWVMVFKAMPFQYLAYFPATIFLGKVKGPALWEGLLIEAAWAVGLIALARVFYRQGLKRYSAYGG